MIDVLMNVMCNVTGSEKKKSVMCLCSAKGCGLCKMEGSEVEIKHLFSMHSQVMQQAHSCSLLINSINESYQWLISAFIVTQMSNWCMVTFDNLF